MKVKESVTDLVKIFLLAYHNFGESMDRRKRSSIFPYLVMGDEQHAARDRYNVVRLKLEQNLPELANAYLELLENSNWTHTSHKVPERGSEVFVILNSGEIKHYKVNEDFFWMFLGNTHGYYWLPCPKRPDKGVIS